MKGYQIITSDGDIKSITLTIFLIKQCMFGFNGKGLLKNVYTLNTAILLKVIEFLFFYLGLLKKIRIKTGKKDLLQFKVIIKF